ncbi:MAG: serine/threonine-protein kinase, partial [Terriglobales bacterium]
MASSSDRWRRLEALFYEALDLKPEARPAFLDNRCAGDPDLRKEVEALLGSAEKPMDFLHQSVREAAHQVMVEGHRVFAPGAQLSHYKIISRLGAGGMGEVYLAEDLHLKRKVALKMLAPELTFDERGLRRFEQEAYAASALNHPNILTIYEFGQADGTHFIASEFVDGATLRQKIKSSKLELNLAIDFVLQIAGALAAAHNSGIVHRDIKPENVIVRTDGIVKVLDFGIAKLSENKLGEKKLAETARRSGLTATSSISEPGMVMGTARYMSPEQARGADVDARSDIFSLGSVFYELVTGKSAFEGATASDVIAEILKTEPPAPTELSPDLPDEVERIIGKALRKDRETRYQSVKDLLIDLQDFKKESEFQAKLQRSARPVHAKTGWSSTTPRRPFPAPPPSVLPSVLRNRRLWSVAALLLAVLVVGYFYIAKSRAPNPARPRTLAVLPFRNLKPDPATDFLGFSLADEIITKLGYVSALIVRPSSSIDKYRNQIIDPKQVARDLKVDTLLTGSFLKDGDDLRINAQLIDVKPDKILWRDSIDLKYDKLLTVQDRVAQQIIKELELNLSPAEAANLKPAKPISNVAYEYYLRGIDLYS